MNTTSTNSTVTSANIITPTTAVVVVQLKSGRSKVLILIQKMIYSDHTISMPTISSMIT